jgi:hypothetical protein
MFVTLSESRPPLRKFLQAYFGWVGLGVGSLMLLVFGAGVFLAFQAHTAHQTDLLQRIAGGSIEAIGGKIHLLNAFVIDRDGVWSLFNMAYGFTAVVSAIIAGAVSGVLANKRRASFVLMTRRSEEVRLRELSKWARGWRHFLASSAGALMFGVAANYAFY